MKIIKIEKVQGRKAGIYPYTFDGKIGLRDKIWFICEKCGVETSKQKRRLDKKYPYCEKCLRVIKTQEKYGVDNVFQLKEVREKIKKTNLEKYGRKSFTQTEEYKEKSKKTHLEKYGCHYTKTEEYFNKQREKKYKNSYERKKENYKNVEIITKFEDYVGAKNKYEYECRLCGNIFEYHTNSFLVEPRCKKCFPYEKCSSIMEKEVIEVVNKTNIDFEVNNRSLIYPYELDIYIPSKNIAIEFNGLYWHSENILGYKKTVGPRQYHIKKTKMCQEKDIRLYHFFEDEWIERKEIVKSMIKNALGLNKEKVFARKTKVIKISFEEKNKFMNENHLQGSDGSNICLALLYNNKIVSVMGFNKGKNKIKDQYKLSRFASEINTQVIGGASKLLKYFIRNYKSKSIYSFSDLRISNGNLYKKLGFKYSKKNPPAYWYVKNEKRFHRFNFRKSKLKKLFPEIYSNDKTEWQIMQEAGYDRIWDCGNDRWILT